MSKKSIASEIGESGPIDGVAFRAAQREDYRFALELYLASTRPLLDALGRWDEGRIVSRFERGFILEDIQMMSAADGEIGWMQVSEKPGELHIDQLHLIESARNRGSGTRLIRKLQECAVESGRQVGLNVIRGNRARRLYERLGFRVESSDDEKMRMVWRGPQGAAGPGG